MPLQKRTLGLRRRVGICMMGRRNLDEALGMPDLVQYYIPGDATGEPIQPLGTFYANNISDIKKITNLRIFFRKLERMAGLQRVVERAEGVINLILNDSLRALVIAGRALSNPITKRIV